MNGETLTATIFRTDKENYVKLITNEEIKIDKPVTSVKQEP